MVIDLSEWELIKKIRLQNLNRGKLVCVALYSLNCKRSLTLVIEILPRLEKDFQKYVDFIQSIAKGREKVIFHDCYWEQFDSVQYPNLILFNKEICLNERMDSGKYKCFVLTKDGRELYQQAYDFLYKNVVTCFPGCEQELTCSLDK